MQNKGIEVNMVKKFTAILLLVTILIGMVTFVYADYNALDIQNELAIDLFEKINVIDADEEFDRYITRLEACQYISKLLKFENVATETYFIDTNDKSVNTLAALGIVQGNGKGYFAPGDIVEKKDLVIMLLRSLGYGIYEKYEGAAWHIKALRETELDDRFLISEPATMEDLIYLMYDAGVSKVFEASSYTEDGAIYGNKNQTLFFDKWDLDYIEGVVCANMVTSTLVGGTALGKANQIQIEEYIYDTDDDFAYKYIGQNINGFYQYDESNSMRKMICFMIDQKSNDTLCIDAKDIISFKDDILKYYHNNKEKVISLDKYDVLYNGKSVSGNFESLFPFEYGNIKIYKDAVTRKYRTVSINDVRYLKVNSVSYDDLVVYTDGNDGYGQLEVKNDADSLFTLQNAEGLPLAVTALNFGDIISVQRSKDGSVVQAVLCGEKISGVLESVSLNGDEKLYSIDGKEYISTTIFEIYCGNIIVGNSYNFIVDNDKVLYATDYANNGLSYGYVYDMAVERISFDEKILVKIFTDRGTHMIAELSEKAKIDGLKKNNQSEIISSFQDKITGDLVRQLIRYRKNNKGQIIEVDTAADNETMRENYGTLWKKASGDLYYNYHELMFENSCIPKPRETKVFMVPPPSKDVDEKNFKIATFEEREPFEGRTTYNIMCYKHNDDEPYIDAIVYHYSSENTKYSGTPYLMVIESISRELVGDEILAKVVGNITGYQTEFYVSEDYDISDIECGDLIRFMYDLQGRVDRIDIVYDYSASAPAWGAGAVGWMGEISLSAVYGDVLSIYRPTDKKRNSLLKIGNSSKYMYTGFNEDKVKIQIVEEGRLGTTVKIGTLDDVIEGTGKMFMLRYGNIQKDLIYYKDK